MKTLPRLIIVSNRLPVTLTGDTGDMRAVPSSGGLVTALGAVLRRQSASWIGWPGTERSDAAEQALRAADGLLPCSLRPVFLSPDAKRNFYYGFSNEIVWPLFHNLPSRCIFDPAYWESYLEVNARFAEAVRAELAPGAVVWVHDYHLMDVARRLRESGARARLAFFHHIPFPPPDIFTKLPWRTDVLRSLLQYDLLGFQTPHDRRNFVACVRQLLPQATLRRADVGVRIAYAGREVRVGSFPISIDYRAFSSRAASREIAARAQRLRLDVGQQQILLGVDRLDYTKGIPERLRALDHLLRTAPELHGRITLVQLVVPSREDIPKYRELRLEVERLISKINGRHAQPGWTPVQYLYRHLAFDELLAYYRAADVCVVTPLRDGMNLVAKEYCAANVDGDGVLILSEFAGAAAQLRNAAVLVNPYDTEGVAVALRSACTMSDDERRLRMGTLRRQIRRHDVFAWADSFLAAACGPGEPQVAAGAAAAAGLLRAVGF